MAQDVRPTPANMRQHRKRLNRKVRNAYQKIEYWMAKHEQAMEEFKVFMFRFPREWSK